jgi:DNA-binding Xre family transcriptional regulator
LTGGKQVNLDEMIEKLKDIRPERIVEATGISRQGLHKILTGRTKNPAYATVQKLREYLEGR